MNARPRVCPLACLGLLALLLSGAASSPALAANVIFKADYVDIYENELGSAMENPSTVRGYTVSQFRDANNGGAPDWTATGFVEGSTLQAWLRDSGAQIQTTTVASRIVAIHLQGDENDGIADILVDGVLKAKLDMFGPCCNNVFVVVRGLSNATHTIVVDDQGPGVGGQFADDIAVWGASALTANAVTVNFADAGVTVFTGMSNPEMEDPPSVQGRPVAEFRDADNGGLPDWAATGLVQGSSSMAWLRDSGAQIQTTTTALSDTISVHLNGDENDGVTDVLVDGVLKARVDMWEPACCKNVQVFIEGLPYATHLVVVDDIGPGTGGLNDDDIAVWGAAVIGQVSVRTPALTTWGLAVLAAIMLLTVAVFLRRTLSA